MTNTSDNARTARNSDDSRSDVLTRAYREAVEKAGAQPPRSIDDAVRAAARQAVSSQRIAVSRSRFRRWRTPLALAATLLLAIGVTVKIYKTSEMDIASRHELTAKSFQEEREAKDKAGTSQPTDEEERRPTKAGETGLTKETAAPGGVSNKAARDRGIKSPAAQVPQKKQPEPKAFPGASGSLAAPTPSSEPAVGPRAELPAVGLSRSRERDATAGKIEQEPAPAADLHRRFERQAEEEKFLATPAGTAPSLAKRLEGRPPEAWIEEIRALKRAARSGEAADLLAEFQKKFPNFTLPDDLK